MQVWTHLERSLIDARSHCLARGIVQVLPRLQLLQLIGLQPLGRIGVGSELQRPRPYNRLRVQLLRLDIVAPGTHGRAVGLQDDRLARLQADVDTAVLDAGIAHVARHGVEQYGTLEVDGQLHVVADVLSREVRDEVVMASVVLAAQHAQS